MATRKVGRNKNMKSASSEPKMSEQLTPKKNETPQQFAERKRAFAVKKIEQILMQNVSKSGSKTFTQYTKSLIKSYLLNPYSYKDSIREVSRYLYRVSTLYKKIVLYYATMPYYYYNVTYKTNFLKPETPDKMLKKYESYLQRMQAIDFSKECPPIVAMAIRDGIYAGFVYDNEEEGLFIHMLDPQYYKLRGKNADGQWIVFFDANYFSVGNNREFVEGINGDMSGTWDQVFVDGWNAYQQDSMNARWFMLPPERTICLLANMDDEFDMPLPFLIGSFSGILDVLDAEQIMADKTALENYALLVSKIPLLDNTDTVDDLAVSLELVQACQEAINEIIPSLVGAAWVPGLDLDVITFNNKNVTEDTDALSNSVKNVFDQVGASQFVVSGGSSTNSIGLKQAIANDTASAFMLVDRLESNLQFYFNSNIDENFIFRFHKETWYNRDEYLSQMKDAATLGSSAMDYLTALGMTPYEAYCKLSFENMIGLKDMMIPLKTSYTDSANNGDSGAPQKDDGDLTDEGIATRDGGKHEGREMTE